MNRQEHLIVKLMEECAEVQQRASKLLQFGVDEIEPGQDLTNERRLRNEITDTLAIVLMLEDAGILVPISDAELAEGTDMKKQKIEKYLRYSVSLGRINPE